MGVSICRGGDGIRGAPPHLSIHKEAAYNHSGYGSLSVCICIVHGGEEDAGDNPDGALVVSRRGK